MPPPSTSCPSLNSRRQQARWLTLAAVALGLTLGAMPGVGNAEAASLKAINAKYHLVSDGARFVAFQRPDGTSMVLDARKGKVRKIQGSKGCEPSAVGYGRVLLNCADGYYFDFKPSRLASVRTGKSWKIPRASIYEEYRAGDIGKYWVRGDCQSGSSCYSTTYTNFRSGTKRTFTTVGIPDSVPEGLNYDDLDLDNRHLGRFKPHPEFSIFTEDFNWGSYIGFGAHYYVVNDYGGMFLVRSPQERVKIGGYLPGTSNTYFSRILARGSGRLGWVDRSWLRAFDLRTGEKVLRRLPRGGSKLALVKQGAVVAIPTDAKRDKRKIFRLRIVKF